MRLALVLAFVAPLAAAQGMGAADARHLLARTGFEARLADVDTFARLSRREAVERLLAQGNGAAVTPAPAWVGEWTDPRRVRAMDPDERKLFVREQIERDLELKGWWFSEMARTSAPLAERMTLFWHNHFTSSLQKVRSPALMYRQNVLLRRHALGNFGELLHGIARSGDARVPGRGEQPPRPAERELRARGDGAFTLGEGQFREDDIREAARAFTGWSIDPASGEYLFRPRIHDSGEKTVLGRKGNFRGEDVLDILLAQPATAQYVAARLWREFVSPQPDAAQLERVARVFRASGYDIRSALRALHDRSVLVEREPRRAHPVAGRARGRHAAPVRRRLRRPLPFVLLLRALGQDIFSPAQRQGLAGRGGVDQFQYASRAQAVPRAPVPRRGNARRNARASDAREG